MRFESDSSGRQHPETLVADGDEVATRGAWHGPASVAGCIAGLLIPALFLVLGASGVELGWSAPDVLAYLLPWSLGLPLLLVRGRVRQFGVGLIASGLSIPTVTALGRILDEVYSSGWHG